jgi:hypothetical protein
VEFIEKLTKKLNVVQDHILTGERGRNGGSYAHWQIFLAYAKYLSPDFHMWANQVSPLPAHSVMLWGSCGAGWVGRGWMRYPL